MISSQVGVESSNITLSRVEKMRDKMCGYGWTSGLPPDTSERINPAPDSGKGTEESVTWLGGLVSRQGRLLFHTIQATRL